MPQQAVASPKNSIVSPPVTSGYAPGTIGPILFADKLTVTSLWMAPIFADNMTITFTVRMVHPSATGCSTECNHL